MLIQIIPAERTSELIGEVIETFIAHPIIASATPYEISHLPILADSTPTAVLQLNRLNKSIKQILHSGYYSGIYHLYMKKLI
jgi:hypothetical protein